MSINSSNKISKILRDVAKQVHFMPKKKSFPQRLGMILVLSSWLLIGFFIAQLFVALLLQGILAYYPQSINAAQQPVLQLSLSALVYLLSLIVVVGAPKLFKIDHQTKGQQKKVFGLERLPSWVDIPFSLSGYAIYFILTTALLLVVQSVWQGFNSEQVQEVGFSNITLPSEYVIAFVALVIIPPIAEELLFRGYLFGRLRKYAGFWVSSLVTSVLFGLAHLQWNVGIDVFALSIVLCFLREKTGSIWAGIFLHMLKNGMAFTILFVKPDVLQFLLQ